MKPSVREISNRHLLSVGPRDSGAVGCSRVSFATMAAACRTVDRWLGGIYAEGYVFFLPWMNWRFA